MSNYEAARNIESLLSVNDVAAIAHVDPSTVWRWTRAGRLAVIRIGGRVLVDPADLRAFFEAHRQPARNP